MKQHDMPPMCWCAAAPSSRPSRCVLLLYKAAHSTQHQHMSLLASAHPVHSTTMSTPTAAGIVALALLLLVALIWAMVRGGKQADQMNAKAGDSEGGRE